MKPPKPCCFQIWDWSRGKPCSSIEAIGYYERSLVLMRRLGNEGGVADAWRMIGRTFLHSTAL